MKSLIFAESVLRGVLVDLPTREFVRRPFATLHFLVDTMLIGMAVNAQRNRGWIALAARITSVIMATVRGRFLLYHVLVHVSARC